MLFLLLREGLSNTLHNDHIHLSTFLVLVTNSRPKQDNDRFMLLKEERLSTVRYWKKNEWHHLIYV